MFYYLSSLLGSEDVIEANVSQDRMCSVSYAVGEDPSTGDGNGGWDEDRYARYRHVLHYRDLFQQKQAANPRLPHRPNPTHTEI